MQMYEELQVLSPLVPTRQLYFLRFCQQIEQSSWAIVDVSYDITQENLYSSTSCKVHRLPSGCLIQDMPNGYSKVIQIALLIIIIVIKLYICNLIHEISDLFFLQNRLLGWNM